MYVDINYNYDERIDDDEHIRIPFSKQTLRKLYVSILTYNIAKKKRQLNTICVPCGSKR